MRCGVAQFGDEFGASLGNCGGVSCRGTGTKAGDDVLVIMKCDRGDERFGIAIEHFGEQPHRPRPQSKGERIEPGGFELGFAAESVAKVKNHSSRAFRCGAAALAIR